MTFTPEILLEIMVAMGSAFGVYAAIRADLARLHERTNQAVKSAEQAHRRIDMHFANPCD